MKQQPSPLPGRRFDERHVWWTMLLIGMGIFAGVLLMGRPLVEGRLQAARNLDGAASAIAKTDSGLARIDAAVRSEAATRDANEDASVRSKIAELRATLRNAETLSQMGNARLTTDEQKRAGFVKASAEARIRVLDAADALFPEPGVYGAPPTQEALRAYKEAVDRMHEADAALARL